MLREGLALHQAGRRSEAEMRYREVLRIEPSNPDALHLMGMLESEQGRHTGAIQWIQKAIQSNPCVPDFHTHLGSVFMAMGRFADAAGAFQKAVSLGSDSADAHYNLGVALHQLGQLDRAIASYQTALRLGPDAAAFNNMGVALAARGRRDEAADAFRQALRLRADHADALMNLGNLLKELGRAEEAIECYQRRLRLPNVPFELVLHLGGLLQLRGRLDEAESLYRQALQARPDPQVLNNLAIISEERGQLDEAERLVRQALAARPDFVEALDNLGNILLKQRKLAGAIASYDKALALQPGDANVRYNRSIALLTLGNLPRAWQEYDWRHFWGRTNSPLLDCPQPLWRGEDLSGRTLLLYGEQGLGDTLQFIRYLPLVAARGPARIFLHCPAELHAVIQGLPGLTKLFAPGESVPGFDTHAPLMDLPCVFGTTLNTIPAGVPYLPVPKGEAPPELRDSGNLKVGIVWAGGTKHPQDRFRSVRLEEFAPLLAVPGIDFYSLQVGSRSLDLSQTGVAGNVVNLAPRLKNFADTAAAMMRLDLVISVDTSVVHLAGALGRPVWTLLPFASDWRWLSNRTDSPWYPTMRLFQQTAPGDWAGVFARVKTALEHFVKHCRLPIADCQLEPASSAASDISNSGFRAPHSAFSCPLYFAGQAGNGFGWGVCNRYLLEELSRLHWTIPLSLRDRRFQGQKLPGNLFTPVEGYVLEPATSSRGKHTFGYAFFEHELVNESVANAAKMDLLFVGSTWCRERLEERGIRNGTLLIQGVDGRIFHPAPRRPEDGRFVIFSGGKFELRKGQDLVLRAFAILSQKYPDMMLVTAWHNAWPQSLQTMAASKHIRFQLSPGGWQEKMAHLCRINGIDPARVRAMDSLPSEQMSGVYWSSDVGLFPNRCEGGTNLVLMEYMACGRPVIASHASGHRDVVHEGNAMLLRQLRDIQITGADGRLAARWQEASVDEIVAAVEHAYHHRDVAARIGQAGAESMREWTWERMARTVLAATGQV
jgi:tetratricopeptide (TPR) repeat protein/glycosyltransferase involved in cell wall biosynthesis